MKILALTSAYPHQDDDGVIVTPTVKYFCEKWAQNGHEVVVIHNSSCFPGVFYLISDKTREKMSSRLGHSLPTKASRDVLEKRKENLLVERFPMVKIIPHGKFSNRVLRKQIDRITSILDRESFVPDVIISHWVNPQIDLLIKLKEKYPRAKTSLVFHDDCSAANIERFSLKERIRDIDAVGCRSRSYAEYVQDKLNLPKTPFICYSGIPDNLAAECANGLADKEFSDKPEFVYVGRLVKYKHVDTVIEALHQVYGNEPFKFHVVGSGAERENLEAMVKEYGMENRVIFHGQVSREEAFALMQQSTFFVMVSEHETFGMVYIEAMLAGCITIAAKGGGVDGVIIDGENGFLSDEGNTTKLACLLNKISSMAVTKKRLIRQNAIDTALTFSDSDVSELYLENIYSW